MFPVSVALRAGAGKSSGVELLQHGGYGFFGNSIFIDDIDVKPGNGGCNQIDLIEGIESPGLFFLRIAFFTGVICSASFLCRQRGYEKQGEKSKIVQNFFMREEFLFTIGKFQVLGNELFYRLVVTQ